MEDSIENAVQNQGVTFLHPDTEPFREAVLPIHGTILSQIPAIQPVYDQIQMYNEMFSGETAGTVTEEEPLILQENNRAERSAPEKGWEELAENAEAEREGRS